MSIVGRYMEMSVLSRYRQMNERITLKSSEFIGVLFRR